MNISGHTCGRISLGQVQTGLANSLPRQFFAVPLGPAPRDCLSQLFCIIWYSCERPVLRDVVVRVRVGLLDEDSLFYRCEPTERVVVSCKLVCLFVRLGEIRRVEGVCYIVTVRVCGTTWASVVSL